MSWVNIMNDELKILLALLLIASVAMMAAVILAFMK
jgi:hypothetical protein